MDNKLISIATDTPLGLTTDILNKLESYEDYLSFYIQLEQASSAFAWLKADLLLQMAVKLGETSVEQLARDIKQPRSTVSNYVRTARAFPNDKRDASASFSIHFKASFADSYDDKLQQFIGDDRFKWVDKAVDEGMSTRVLGDAIQREKKREELQVLTLPCSKCHKSDGIIKPFLMYSPGSHEQGESFELHEECYQQVLNFIYGK